MDNLAIAYRNIARVFKRHGFELSADKDLNVEIKFSKRPAVSPKVKFGRFVLSLSMFVVFISLFALTAKFRFILIFLAFLAAWIFSNYSSSVVNDRNYDIINLNLDSISLIKDGEVDHEITTESIEKIEINLPKDQPILQGNLIFHKPNGETINMLSFQGEHNSYLEDDLEIITQFLHLKYYS